MKRIQKKKKIQKKNKKSIKKNEKDWKMSKNFKKSDNLKQFQKIQKNHIFSKNLKILKNFFFAEKKKNAILLVLPNEEISLRPELSSPPRFRIQGGYPERQDGRTDGRTNEGNPRV